jgi:hypothetical protein
VQVNILFLNLGIETYEISFTFKGVYQILIGIEPFAVIKKSYFKYENQ